jgi:hypothetical protein
MRNANILPVMGGQGSWKNRDQEKNTRHYLEGKHKEIGKFFNL